MNTKELSAKIDTLQNELKSVFDAHKIADGFDMPADVLESVEAREAELKGLNDQLTKAKTVERIAEQTKAYHDANENVARLPMADVKSVDSRRAVKTIGELAFEAKAFNAINQSVSVADVDVKTVMSTSAGWSAPAIRSDVVALSAQRPLSLLDYLPSQNVNVPAYRYMLETTFTNNAAELAEAGTYAEGALALTEQNIAIRKVGVTLPYTEEQIADVPAAQDYITQRMSYMLKNRLETQVLSGDGSAPNIKGLVNFSGVLTQAKSTDNAYDAIFKAITKIKAQGQVDPNLIVMHPTDWQTIRIGSDVTGRYILDNPAVGQAYTLFGLPVIVSTVATQGQAVIMDTNQVSVLYRNGVEFMSTNSHASEFLAGTLRLRADIRAAVALYRATAVCTVTGL